MRPSLCEQEKESSHYKCSWYGSYRSMMDRCYRSNAKNFPFYGGRGITVCEEWHDINNFERWAKISGHQKGLSLERKDVNKGYSPDNCMWATPKQQANNRRNTLHLELDGVVRSVHEWSEMLGMNPSTLSNRHYRGWSDKDVLTYKTIRKGGSRGKIH